MGSSTPTPTRSPWQTTTTPHIHQSQPGEPGRDGLREVRRRFPRPGPHCATRSTTPIRPSTTPLLA
eukprot:663066-Pyramimonas_sp.AAC.1